MVNRYRKYTLILFLIVHVVACHTTTAQSLQIIRYAEDDGLSNTLVKSVSTDSKGVIWVATDGGVFLFDGHEFSHYSGELPSPYVKSVLCRSNGEVVIATDLGVVIRDDKRKNHAHTTILKGSVQEVDSLLWFPKGCYEDRSGKLWFGDNRKIYMLRDGKIESFFPGEKAITNNFQRSFSFAEDGFGHLFSFAETGFVYKFNPSRTSFEEVILPEKLTNIQFALTVDTGTILIATRTGIVEFQCNEQGVCKGIKLLQGSPEASCLFEYAPHQWYAGTWANGMYDIQRKNEVYTISPIAEITEKNINNIVKGSEGNVWIASDNGLLLLQKNLFSSPFRSITRDYIQCINLSKTEKIFCDGKRVYRTPSPDDPPSRSIEKIKEHKATLLQAIQYNGGYWFSDVDAQVWYEKPLGRTVKRFNFGNLGRAVFYMNCDAKGNLWICQDQNASLIRITPDFSVKNYGEHEGITSRPLVTATDEKGIIFAGGMSDSAYLFRYNATTDRFENLSKPILFEHNIDVNINDIAVSKKGTIWLGSSFGLLKFAENTISRIDFGEMTSSSVKAVAVDQYDDVWLGNSIGLHLYANNELLSFDERTGISSKIINYRCLRIDDENALWVGTVEGVMVSSPLSIPHKTVTPVIFSILLNNEKDIPYRPSGVSFNDHSFATLKVGVLDYPYVNFSLEMFLKGRDSVWQPVPRSGAVILANLPPGDYTFMIRAKKTGNYLTSEVKTWNFSVSRIWYTKIWVLACLAVILFLLFWFGLHLYTINLKRYNERLERAIQERTRETLIQKDRIAAQNESILAKNEELKQINIHLEKAKELAEEASEAQKKFLSVMTHELRTPLNAVIGAAHLLIRNNPRQDQFEDLQILRFSAENLLRLINNILDFTKIESGKVSLEQVEFNLRNLVEEIVSAMKIRANEKGILLESRIDSALPEILVGDPLRLAQIINNLMGNSMKFTEKGFIRINLILQQKVDNQVTIGFSIRDTGIGMSEETLNSIFEIFVQGSSETTRKYGGTGLGLVITEKLLELFGSKIKVESKLGSGSTFSFSITFPEGTPSGDKKELSGEAYHFTPFSGQKLLLVEDNKINRLIANKFLKEWNLHVEEADNGLEAIEKMEQSNFDLILMDIQMPELDGYQTASRIREKGVPPFSTIPIIALTAAIRSDVSAMVFRSGMNDIISKPFNPIELHSKLKSYLG